jgi:hypothetical protein
MMEKITCTIEHITYQNPDNGYAVLQASVKGYRENQTLVGTFHEVTVGASDFFFIFVVFFVSIIISVAFIVNVIISVSNSLQRYDNLCFGQRVSVFCFDFV